LECAIQLPETFPFFVTMQKQDIIKGYQSVDSSQTEFLKKFLEDVSQQPDIRESFELQLQWLDIQPGMQVLDIGCGIGVQASEMARRVGAEGKVTGTDLSAAMIDIANSTYATSELPLEFKVADALHQPFADESFDRIRMERVLMYIKDTATAFTEFRRLLKPGGKLLIFDTDWDALVIDHSNRALTRKIVRYVSDSFPNGRVGSQLYRHFKDFGFKEVRVKPFSYSGRVLNITKRICEGVLQTGIADKAFTAEEITAWWKVLEEEEKAKRFFASYACFIVAGVK
jgi:ubiquinone/menaquinone biosynthesis C-methylase UbiE